MHSPPPSGTTGHGLVTSLSQGYASGSMMLPKYPEPGMDFHSSDPYRFMAEMFPPSVIHSEAARCMSVIGHDVSMLLDERTFDPELMAYMADHYHKFDRSRLIGYAPGQHIKAVMEHVRARQLVVMHPYGHIPTELYQTHPDTIVRLNDKTELSRLVDPRYLPKERIMSLAEVAKIRDFPVVLKWHSGASGDGVAILQSIDDLNKAIDKFGSEPSILVQEFLHIVKNRSAQFAIGEDGARFVGTTTQRTSPSGEYMGNIIHADEPWIEPDIEPGLWQLVSNAHRLGYRGFCGIDYVQTRDGRYLIIDPNFRITGATAAILHRNAGLAKRTGGSMIHIGSFESNMATVGEVVRRIGGYSSLYLLSAFSHAGETRGYAMVVMDDASQSEHLAKELKWYGIALSGMKSE